MSLKTKNHSRGRLSFSPTNRRHPNRLDELGDEHVFLIQSRTLRFVTKRISLYSSQFASRHKSVFNGVTITPLDINVIRLHPFVEVIAVNDAASMPDELNHKGVGFVGLEDDFELALWAVGLATSLEFKDVEVKYAHTFPF